MQPRPYDEIRNLRAFPVLNAKEEERDSAETSMAVKQVFGKEIAEIARGLNVGRSVLVCCPKNTAKHVFRSLGKKDWSMVSRHGGESQGPLVQSLTQDLSEKLADAVRTQHRVVIGHLDLLTTTATEQLRGEANEVVYWLAEYPSVTKLAFYDPSFRLPKVIEDFFPTKVSLETFDREETWKLFSVEEAQKFCTDPKVFDVASQLQVYQYLSGTNVGEIRRMLRDMPKYSAHTDAHQAFDYLRKNTAAQPIVEQPKIAGYKNLLKRLDTQVIEPLRRRYTARTELDFLRYEALIPRGLLLHGKPGVGKTELMKYLAWQLGATLFLVHGPELKGRYVGETESAIRRLFAQARRAAPSMIAIDEADALFPARSVDSAHHESSMVGQFLTEMQGLRRGEPVIVVASTNVPERLDEAFRRPGRFHLIEVPYPADEDRREILELYNEHFKLGLTADSIKELVRQTEGVIDVERERDETRYFEATKEHTVSGALRRSAGPELDRRLRRQLGLDEAPARFSGDHLRAIVLHLLSAALLENRNVNDSAALGLAVQTVRNRLGTDQSAASLKRAGADGIGGRSGRFS